MNQAQSDELENSLLASLSDEAPNSDSADHLFRSVLLDTTRATESSKNQMKVIVEGLDKQIENARVVRDLAIKRIDDLVRTREATTAYLDVLARKG